MWGHKGFLERWSQVVGASDTTVKEASLRQGPCPPTPIKVRPDSALGSSLALWRLRESRTLCSQPAVVNQLLAHPPYPPYLRALANSYSLVSD